MKINSSELISNLISITHSNIKKAESLKALDATVLNKKPSATAWSILECLEHLNRYDAFYLPAIQAHLDKEKQQGSHIFKSGLIGSYLVKAVIPRENSKKMKTFSTMDPAGSNLSTVVIETFLSGQQSLLKQLEQAKNLNLNRGGIPVTFSKLVKLKLGDALQFMAYHNQRHVQQAMRNILKADFNIFV